MCSTTSSPVYFRPTSLFDTLMILELIAAGLGLVARSLAAQGTDAGELETRGR